MGSLQGSKGEVSFFCSGSVTSMEYDAVNNTAIVYQDQTVPMPSGETADVKVCEKYFFHEKAKKHYTKVLATAIGSYSQECPTSKFDADWVVYIRKMVIGNGLMGYDGLDFLDELK
eukprot:scaffold246269_cov30-Prasinocladus_malaysianus.AAC.1